jgi:hypothetical protein
MAVELCVNVRFIKFDAARGLLPLKNGLAFGMSTSNPPRPTADRESNYPFPLLPLVK